MSRGCGDRVGGGIYAEVQLSDHGRPFTDFLLCSPLVVDAGDLGISSIGVKLIETDGVWHIFDIVGKKHYPNVSDFIEEAMRMGISRRLSKSIDFKKLTPQSKLILLHEKAYIENFKQYVDRDQNVCFKNIPSHNCVDLKEMCVGIWWKDIVGGKVEEGRDVIRNMPDFFYKGKKRPEGVDPKYSLAIFGSFPIHNLAVVRDDVENSHEQSFEKANESSLDVQIVDF